MFELWTEYAPNLKQTCLGQFTRSPLDVERTFPNMREGDLLIGGFMEGQIGDGRPFAGAGQYRARPEGLYLCGSSSHPGGNITWLPGYNCAQVLLADLGLPVPWAPAHLESRLDSL
jgi:phytoene dehydrogenase-like protein